METTPLNDRNGVSYGESKSSVPTADAESAFICNVCLEITNKEPVVTQCGHLYCWPCLYRWMNSNHANHTSCPVCKAGVTKENVIPLFIRGSEEDPRNKTPPTGTDTFSVPNRPPGRRPDPVPNAPAFTASNNALPYGVVTFSAGFGFFPSLFGLQFQSFPSLATHNPVRPLTEEEVQHLHLSRMLIAMGSLVILALIFF
jgi:E3 ubiquitin-protein ligase RNF5